MKQVTPLNSFNTIKLLADSRRLDVLRLLMASPATLTQLARVMKQSPAWVRHHTQTLESAGLIEVSEVRRTGKVTEKFYRAKADALFLQEVILPKMKKPAVIFSGSHDLALGGIAAQIEKQVILLNMPVGSLDGLVNLRQGLCQISGSHLLAESGEYNTPFIRHLFPDREVELFTLAHRTQGLMLAKGNPLKIHTLADVVNRKARFVNRNPGSGTRLWVDAELRRLNLSGAEMLGFESQIKTHSEAARLIAEKRGDVSVGLQAAARQFDLDFIPLFEERYDFVLPREHEAMLMPLIEYLQTAAFRAELNTLTGYNTSHSGEKLLLS